MPPRPAAGAALSAVPGLPEAAGPSRLARLHGTRRRRGEGEPEGPL